MFDRALEHPLARVDLRAYPLGQDVERVGLDGWRARNECEIRRRHGVGEASGARDSVASDSVTGPLPNSCSTSPLAPKLGIKPGARVALVRAPDGFSLGGLPGGVVVRSTARGPLDVIVAFFVTRAVLERRLPALVGALDRAGGLWIAWPKRASGVETDLSDDIVRSVGLEAGLVDNKVCAIDAVWSGLRFVYRLGDR